MNPEIKIAKQPINNYFSNNDEDFIRNTRQPYVYKCRVIEKNMDLELTIVWLESGFKVVSLDHLILNCIDKIGGCVKFNKTGKIEAIGNVENKTIIINQELVNDMNLNDIKALDKLFGDLLREYSFTIEKIDSSSFGIFYITDFKITDIHKKELLFNKIINKCKEEFQNIEINF